MRPARKLPPIAMLHSVSDFPGSLLNNWSITHNKFLQLLDYLESNHFETTHFAGMIEKDNIHSKGLAKKVILTFDDCYKGLLDFAIPELLKRKMKASFYIPTAYIGKYNEWDMHKGYPRQELMNENDIKELSGLGMEIGPHSHHHIDLKDISYLDVVKEVTTSKRILERIIQKQVYSFAYPYGIVPDGYKTILGEAGYQYAVSIYHPWETNFTLRRFGIYNKDTPASVAFKLSTGYKWIRKFYDALKRSDP